MEIRELQYFLTVVGEGTISGAAKELHLSQPSLSRQIKELEEKLGKSLFVRGNRKISLTEEGELLYRRANEIVALVQKAENEIASANSDIEGDIYIGAAETKSLHFITEAAAKLRRKYPKIRFHIASGDTNDTMYQLEQGLIDFALLFSPRDIEKYNFLTIPAMDKLVAIMRKDNPLSQRKSLSLQNDLAKEPLIISRLARNSFLNRADREQFNISGTYNLAYNASIMVQDGLGTALCFDGIVNVNNENDLCAVPVEDLEPVPGPVLMWKKYRTMTNAAGAFINILQQNQNA